MNKKHAIWFSFSLLILCLLLLTACTNTQTVKTTSPEQQPVTAIDILLEPDATIVRRAVAVNKRLLNVYPKGFALDASHTPHITLIQRYVRTAELDKVYAATGKVLTDKNIADWKLKAFKYYYIPTKDIDIAGIVIEPTAQLFKLQQELIDAVSPYTVKTGTAAAFASLSNGSDIQSGLIDYVREFVPKYSGEHFNPHVTVGVATQGYLNVMLAEPFEKLTFSPASASIFQLGSSGTAMKKTQGMGIEALSLPELASNKTIPFVVILSNHIHASTSSLNGFIIILQPVSTIQSIV